MIHHQKGWRGMKMISKLLLLFFVFSGGLHVVHGDTVSGDAAALRSLMNYWENSPPSWGKNDDPCGLPWEGVECKNSRVTSLKLSTMGLNGTLSSDISQLSELQLLDLSYNIYLGGQLPTSIGNLKQITNLILVGCSFSGIIPQSLGGMEKLSFLALNSNKFTGIIPPSIGLLSNLYWLDLADNQLTGPIPISSNSTPGLDLLNNTKHFHFSKNRLSGTIPSGLFSSQNTLIHLLLDSNNFSGQIPESIGLVTSLEALRLDRNSLSGPVPSSIKNLIAVSELNLANNMLRGPLPNLTSMNNLHYVDLSNNSFDRSEAPAWFSTIQSLTTLVIESGKLYGNFPSEMFNFPQLQQVLLRNNEFNGTLDLGDISSVLRVLDFENNTISGYTSLTTYNEILILVGNPVCTTPHMINSSYCSLPQQKQSQYSTSLDQCYSISCSLQLSVNPQSCACAYPYQGLLIFRAPSFRDLTNRTRFQELERSLWSKLSLTPGSVYLSQVYFNEDNYLQVELKLFQPNEMFFTRSEIQKLGLSLSSQTFKPPAEFGPYVFIADQYFFPDNGGTNSMSMGVKAGIAVGCIILIMILVVLTIYAIRQKRRAERAVEQSKPFATWASTTKANCGAPQLKGTRLFSFDELKRSTNNFSEANEIGSGGYGKVYKGILSSGELVAVKRAKQGSMQGGHEFKTEIELLSRVHHKNLVGLVGFCFEQGEQMLVYEYIPNGTLRESLTGISGIHLDWVRRLKIALGSARGLAYLHELANPPIIHRDVKSTNILLDETLTAKVADLGLSKLVSDSELGHISTQVKGTLGYLDPQYYMTQQLTEKSDVYSFGVVMLELITAKPPIEYGKYIVKEVSLVLDDKVDEYCGLKHLIDPTITKTTNLLGFRRFVELSMKCVNDAAACRPTMNEVVKEIETMLQNEGLNTNSNSAASSATDFGYTKGAYHPYSDSYPRTAMNSNSFEYSGGLSLPARVEPM